ncbi:hypothetical protein [Cryobacterium zongtaii]|nr:hypothetical protein [Cryobacterium zongtaii]
MTKIAAGNFNTTWWRSGTTGITQNAGAVTILTSAVSLVSITRS